MKASANTTAVVVPKTHAPPDDTAAEITLAAAAGERHVVDQVFGGYDAAPTNGSLTIASTVNGVSVSQVVPVTSAGALFFKFDYPLQGDDNTDITITLAAGGSSVGGIINAMTR